ncbi:MAG: AAA family ATPase [Patescibacteria group bacterium]
MALWAQMNPLLLVLAGPAGSGKSTLCDRLVKERPEFSRVVTTTTRAPRTGEIDGVHYHFLAPLEFRRRIANGDFLEWTQVHGDQEDRLYGTLRSSVLDPLAHGRDLVMNIDVKGVDALRQIARSEAILRRSMATVFIRIDHARIVERMKARDGEQIEEIRRRIATADRELLEAPKFDFVIESRTRDEDFSDLLRIDSEARRRLDCAA